MLIENWIEVIIVVLTFASNFVLAISGMKTDERLEDERIANDELQEENKALRKEVARLQSKIDLARLHVEIGGNKK